MVQAMPAHIKQNFCYAKIYRKVHHYRSNADFIVIGEPGCQPKGSKVLMTNGNWKNIEEIKVGDKIISPQQDGSNIFSKVKSVVAWDSKENYTVIELNKTKRKLYSCSYNHLIPTFHYCYNRKTINNKRYAFNRRWELKNYCADTFSKMSIKRKSHQNIAFSSFEIKTFEGQQNYFVEPYTLGVVLGDGHFSSKLYTRINTKSKEHNLIRFLANKLSITSDDIEIINKVSTYYKIRSNYSKQGTTAVAYGFSPNGKLFKALLKTGLVNKKSGAKFIPLGAKLSDSNYRKELLAGLIDTDGYYSNGGYEITSKSKQLATDIIDIVYSIGGRGRVRVCWKKAQGWAEKKKYYTAAFYLNDMELPLTLERKIKKCKSVYLSSNRVAIDCIKSKPCKVYGFELDSKSQLYITDNWMVTHNTGKSSLAQRVAYDMDESFNLQRIVYSTKELVRIIRYGEVVGKNEDGTDKFKRLKIGSAIIFDETAGSAEGADSRSALSKTNKTMSYLKTIYRDYKLIVFYIAPSLSQIDKNVKLVATTGVFWTKKQDPAKKTICATFYWSKSNLLMGKHYNKKPMIISPMNNNMYGIRHLWFPYSPKHIFMGYAKIKRQFMDERLAGWLVTDKELAEANKPKTFKDYWVEANEIKDELCIDGKYDWGLVSAKLNVGGTIATKISSLLNKGATL